jgi:hypothetical protein
METLAEKILLTYGLPGLIYSIVLWITIMMIKSIIKERDKDKETLLDSRKFLKDELVACQALNEKINCQFREYLQDANEKLINVLADYSTAIEKNTECYAKLTNVLDNMLHEKARL